jgi:hypothetical protein
MDGGGDDNVRPSLSPCIQIEENLQERKNQSEKLNKFRRKKYFINSVQLFYCLTFQRNDRNS